MSQGQTSTGDSPAKNLPESISLASAKPKPEIPINIVRLQRYIVQAQAQQAQLARKKKALKTDSQPAARLDDEMRSQLEQEWWCIIDDSMKFLDMRLTCLKCGAIHDAPRATDMANALREEMETHDVENISDHNVKHWKENFEGIEVVYWEEAPRMDCEALMMAHAATENRKDT